MAKIKFANGNVVNFDGDPTPEDIEEVAASLGFDSPSVSGAAPLNPEKESPPDPVRRALSILPVAGGVVGGLVGGPGGAFLFGAGGEAYRQIGSRVAGLDSPDTSLEAAKRIGIEGITQGAGEFAGSKILSPIMKAAGRGVKKPFGDLFQLITKMKPEDAATLFRNPKAILPGQWSKAQKAWRSAAKKIGIEVNDVSPEMIEILKGDAKQKVFETYGKIQRNEDAVIAWESVAKDAGFDPKNVSPEKIKKLPKNIKKIVLKAYDNLERSEPVSAKVAQIAKQALDIVVMPVAKTVRKNPLVATLSKIRRKFVERIGQESPEMAAANKQYGIASVGKKFQSIFPRNLDNSPAYFRSSVLPSLLATAGVARGEPGEGVLQGAALAGLTSPLAIGAAISGAGTVRPLLPYVRRAGTAAAADLVKKYLERE